MDFDQIVAKYPGEQYQAHCSAGNGQWPSGQMRLIFFVWDHQKSPNYGLQWPKFIFLAIVNEWDLQLVAILGHQNFGLFSFWATTLILGVSSTALGSLVKIGVSSDNPYAL